MAPERTWPEACNIGECNDKLTALVLYQADEEEWKYYVEWFMRLGWRIRG